MGAARCLDMRPLLISLLVIGVAGLVFSGYLSYRELFAAAPVECAPLGQPGTMLGAPVCVYGFVMYLAIVILTSIALARRHAAT